MADITQRINDFKSDLANKPEEYVLRKNVIFGECFHLDSKKYYELKQEIANKFNLHPSCILMVGSGKLGFSLSEKIVRDEQGQEIERKERYREFSENSDLDIAIVSPLLFDKYWLDIYKHARTWYCDKQFKDYLFSGWIRPDKFPPTSDEFKLRKEWFEYFEELSSSSRYGRYSISAGLYKDWHFLESYQLKSISQCKSMLVEVI